MLQEFFTAQSFEERRANGLQAQTLWPEQWWAANGWEEAAKLAAEYEVDPKPFLQWLAVGNPKLAAEIAREQGLLDDVLFAELRIQWQNAITDIANYPNPHERHAISTVLAWLNWDNRPGLGIDDIDWVEIPAGEFTYQDGERLSLPTYKMSRYPVTNAQFQAFVADGGYETDKWWEGLQKPESKPEHWRKEGNRPVESVDWYESIAFCRWLSAKTGQEIRLPTEQQWEKAARGSDGREYPWEGGYKTGDANINETYGDAGSYNLGETSAVGIYPQGQSPYGLMDMSGNVWEWCLNKYEEPQITTADVSGGVRVVRGGAWYNHAEDCRASFRDLSHPRYRDYYRGFRLLCCSPH
ncbi:MAG: formylglycine-generating enzyme family protein [Thiothrix sp.]|uniref:formylglycine-generating enzyme family protein n=1 Tax=Thiothrix sp. TaxID=1032 RepID=UPI00260682A9|nr:formylglycine-generating enzyme family protein [Thiothrix sp.]MDD5393677.1 formylglycine-generating enzyme family protein [Thiothrix sp.]